MRKSIAVFATALAILLSTYPATAQEPGKVYRVGYLLTYGYQPGDNEEAFRQGMRELGYIEGQNIVIEWRFAQWETYRVVKAAAELVRLKVNLIVTGDQTATKAALKATRTIPIVVAVGAEGLVAQGRIASLRRPGALGC